MRTDLYYQQGFKYQITEQFIVDLPTLAARIPDNIHTDFCTLSTTGRLTIFKYYAWDGPSGPTIDTRNTMAGSLIHDVLYQLIRRGYLPLSVKDECDNIMRAIMREDGMSKFRSKYFLLGTDWFGDESLVAPRDTFLIPAGTASKQKVPE